jgi:hypothetical protein
MLSLSLGGVLGGPGEACVKKWESDNARGSRSYEGGFAKKESLWYREH